MEFTTRPVGDLVAVIEGTGRLNMLAAPLLRAAVSSAIAEGRVRVVVNLAHVDFMDSSGLGALISGLKSARQAGGDLRIAAPNPQVSMVLQLSNLDRVLSVRSDPDQAFDD